ncbi:MAG: hypothetical protein H6R26_1893, partial [Proteobacteria bacterium]|nr:hypothetical protein [Pseudomonadota bacterium]
MIIRHPVKVDLNVLARALAAGLRRVTLSPDLEKITVLLS